MSEPEQTGEIILYQTDDGRTRLECRFVDESIWLTQRLMAELFQTTVPNINQHLKAVFEEGAREVTRAVEHYNLDVVLAVGYRVRFARGTSLRPCRSY